MKRTFRYSNQWSDYGEGSDGALPSAVVLPDGERVGLDDDTIFAVQWEDGTSRAGYIQVHPNVRVRLSSWGDPGRRSGRAGGKMEVLAPKGSDFRFTLICPQCGERVGDCAEAELTKSAKPPERYHKACEKEQQELEAFLEAEYARMAGD